MKDVLIVYDACCLYEIVILNYFMSFAKCDVLFCSLDGQPVRTMEGYSVNVDTSLCQVDKEQIRSFIVPGGKISHINTPEVRSCLQALKKQNVLIAGICAGVDLLDDAGILNGIRSTHSSDDDMVSDQNIVTARANAYVDFAIQVAKELDLFESEQDLQETVDFWKNYKRMQ